jgi:hypothetical protein
VLMMTVGSYVKGGRRSGGSSGTMLRAPHFRFALSLPGKPSGEREHSEASAAAKLLESGPLGSPFYRDRRLCCQNCGPSQTFKRRPDIEAYFAMPSTKVLLLGNNPELLWLREAVLRCAGFDVLTSLNLQDGLARIQGGDCGALVLCYSLPFTSRKRMAETFRANCPHGRIITVMNEKGEPEFADAFVFGVDGPEALIEAIRTA